MAGTSAVSARLTVQDTSNFTVFYTANSSASLRLYTVTCHAESGTDTLEVPIPDGVTVYGDIPVITSVCLGSGVTDPNCAEPSLPIGTSQITINGQNLSEPLVKPNVLVYTGTPGDSPISVNVASNATSSSATTLNATVTVPSGTASGEYTVSVFPHGTTYGLTGDSFEAAPGSANQDKGKLRIVSCNNPKVNILSRPIRIVPSTSRPGTYEATLTSSVSASGGVYTWTTDNSSMVGFITSASGPSASQVTLGIISTNDKATITLTYLPPCGGESVTDSFTFALTNQVTVLGWIDGTNIQPDASTLLAATPNSMVYSSLTGLPADALTCRDTLTYYGAQGGTSPFRGVADNGFTYAERDYINHFVLGRSANEPPPATMSSFAALEALGQYRLLQTFQASYEVSAGIIDPRSIRALVSQTRTGRTPEPCSRLEMITFAGETSSIDASLDSTVISTGSPRTSSALDITYQVNEARVGTEGQNGNQYVNGVSGTPPSISMPWVWSAIQCDANGKTRVFGSNNNMSTLSLLPSFRIYFGGTTYKDVGQGDIEYFLGLTSITSSYQLPQ